MLLCVPQQHQSRPPSPIYIYSEVIKYLIQVHIIRKCEQTNGIGIYTKEKPGKFVPSFAGLNRPYPYIHILQENVSLMLKWRKRMLHYYYVADFENNNFPVHLECVVVPSIHMPFVSIYPPYTTGMYECAAAAPHRQTKVFERVYNSIPS